MSIQQRICEAFCESVRVNPIRGGYGISSPYADSSGDLLGYYVLGPSEAGLYKIVDNALTVASFESEGATLDSDTRLGAFNAIIKAYGAEYDEGSGELSIANVTEAQLERKALDFMALLLRLQNMRLITQDRVRSAFFEDVKKRLYALNVPGLSVEARSPVDPRLAEVLPDFLLRRERIARPVALFLVSGTEKLWQAMHLKLVAEHEAKLPVSIVAMLESETTATSKMRARASNRLNAITFWEGDEDAAVGRLLTELEATATNSVH